MPKDRQGHIIVHNVPSCIPWIKLYVHADHDDDHADHDDDHADHADHDDDEYFGLHPSNNLTMSGITLRGSSHTWGQA